MQLLAAMASINLAQQQKISRNKAFSKFIKSQTGKMLFDKSTDLWMNGPDYIADEYRREMLSKRKKELELSQGKCSEIKSNAFDNSGMLSMNQNSPDVGIKAMEGYLIE